ncbi:MAG: F0F1 ATP synthase subunit gamma [Candidatus Omnitrophica bacterium]|nr:F0F1 ATP synthase subunit gamma [Candidatus Omnitrophota bacterium]
MSKATAAKLALEDHQYLLDLLEILKNIAANRFYKKHGERKDTTEVESAINDFFRVAYASESGKELFSLKENSRAAVLGFTADGGFMGSLTTRVIGSMLKESSDLDIYEFILIGKKGVEKLKPLTDKTIVSVSNVSEESFYMIALRVKDHVLKLLADKKISKFVAFYPKAVSLNVIKYEREQLFPPEELIKMCAEAKPGKVEKVIFESDPAAILGSMSGIWLVYKITVMLIESAIAGYAAQAQQLENSLDTMEKIGKKLLLTYRKAKRAEIDKSLREAYCSTLMAKEAE